MHLKAKILPTLHEFLPWISDLINMLHNKYVTTRLVSTFSSPEQWTYDIQIKMVKVEETPCKSEAIGLFLQGYLKKYRVVQKKVYDVI